MAEELSAVMVCSLVGVELQLKGLGNERLQDAGVELVGNNSGLSSIGLIEVTNVALIDTCNP